MAAHDLLDVFLVAALVAHVARGWRAGGLASALATAGALGGGLFALWAVPWALGRWVTDASSPFAVGQPGCALLVLVGTFLGATFGEALLSPWGARLAARARGRWLRGADRLAGALLQAVVFAVIASALGTAVKPVLPTSWAGVTNRSRVLPVLADATPEQVDRWAAQATRRLDGLGFPRVFSGLQHEPDLPAAAPDDSAKGTPAVRRASASIVKVTAHSDLCSRGQEGSGWVVAPHRVVTNAHVVAGSSSTRVQVTGKGRLLEATVVAFDPSLDLAILDVPSLAAPALKRSGPLAAQQDAVVAGFPLNGPYTLRSARVRGVVQAVGDDIYGRSRTSRQVYSIHADVQPGNSGGPLITTRGTVAGTVFARSTAVPSTGYVLTDAATDALLDRAAGLTRPVSTQQCTAA